MIPIEEFRNENQEIRDLCNILNLVIEEFTMRNNSVVSELLDRFADRVTAHL